MTKEKGRTGNSPERPAKYYIERSKRIAKSNAKIHVARENDRQAIADARSAWDKRAELGWLALLNNPDGAEEIDRILTDQAKASDAITAANHAEATQKEEERIEKAGTDRIIVSNPQTGERQTYDEYQEFLAQQAGTTASSNVIEVEFSPAPPSGVTASAS